MESTINYNGTEIFLYGNYIGTAKPWGDYVKHHIEIDVTIDGKTESFDYYCNDCDLDDEGFAQALHCFVGDAISYDNARDIDDFQSEFGYEKVSDCLKAYNGCKDAYEKWEKITDIDIYDFYNWLQEKYNL